MRESFYKIQNPSPKLPSADFEALLSDPAVMNAVTQAQARYLSWEEFRYKSWVPGDKEKVWAIVKIFRRFAYKRTPIMDESGKYYNFDPRSHVQFLHKVDLELGGTFLGIEDFSESDKRRFARRNLIEESIASSQLEGANTSREAAKKMLREGRDPTNKDERMIVNNHETMQWIERDLKNSELSIDLLKELHTRITWKTIQAQHQGVLRETVDDKGNKLVIKPWDDRRIAYVTPSREFVEQQIPRFLLFCNGDDEGDDVFIHPVIKAIMIHFWLALLHPFEDGNGRLARVLFYWFMLRKGYWAFSYLSISERIKKSPGQYAKSFIYTEQDDYDLNHFIWYNMAKIRLARDGFELYVKRKIKENKAATELIRSSNHLNNRQINLLQYLARDEQRYSSLNEYMNANEDIGKVTAASDLRRLVEGHFLEKIRRGRNIYYYPTNKVAEITGQK
jgi:Fic family protein